MKNLFSSKIFITAIALIAIGTIGYFVINSMTEKSNQPNASQSQQPNTDEEELESSLDVDVNSLRKDLPLYPGAKHEPLPMMGAGYYRWNVTTPESDISAVGDDVKKLAIDKGWEVYSEHQTDAGYELGFSKEGDKVIVNARNDGLDGKAVASFVGINEIWLPILVGITGLISIYVNRYAGGIFGVAPAYVAITAFLASGGDHWIVPVFALIGVGYALLVQRLSKITLKHQVMDKEMAFYYGLLLATIGAASTWICIQLAVPHPYWFIFAAIMVLHPQRTETLKVMWKRALATVVGALIAIAILHLLPVPIIIVIAVALAILFLYYLLLNKYFAQITLITILLLVILSISAHDTSNELSLTRIWLTLAGTAFAAALYGIGILTMRIVDKKNKK